MEMEKEKPRNVKVHAKCAGFDVEIALDCSLHDLPAVLAQMRKHGIEPSESTATGYKYTPEGLPICPRHGVPMRKREKQGDTWFSHTTSSGRYCRGYRTGTPNDGYDDDE